MKASKPFSILLATFFFLLTLVVASYVFWPFWSPTLLNQLLANSQLYIEEMDISRPGLTSMVVKNSRAAYLSGENEVVIDVPQAEVNYTIKSLLNGKLISVKSSFVDAKHSKNNTFDNKPSSPPNLPLVLPAEIFKAIPIGHIEIGSFRLSSPLLSEYGNLTGHFLLSADQFELDFSAQKKTNLDFLFHANKNNEVKLIFQQERQPVLTILSQVKPHDSGHLLNIRAAVDIGRTSLVAQRLGWLEQSIKAVGNIDASWQMELPSNIEAQSLKALEIKGGLNSVGEIKDTESNLASNFNVQVAFAGNSRSASVHLNNIQWVGSIALPKQVSGLLNERKVSNQEALNMPFSIQTRSNSIINMRTMDNAWGFALDEGELVASLGTKTDGTRAKLRLRGLEFELNKSWRLKSEISADYGARALIFSGMETGLVDGDFKGDFTVDPSGVALQLKRGSQLKIKQVKVNKGVIPALSIRNTDPLKINLFEETMAFSNTGFAIKIPNFSWDNEAYSMQSGRLELKRWSIDENNAHKNMVVGEAFFEEVKSKEAGMKLTPVNLEATFQLKGEKLTGRHLIQDQTGLIQLQGKFEHSLEKEKGEMAVVLVPIVFTEQQAYLPKFINNWEYPLDLTAGQVDASVRFLWQEGEVDSKTIINFKGINGFYERNLFAGLNGKIVLSGELDNPVVQQQTLTLSKVDVGFPVENVTFTVGGTLEKLQLQNLHAELLGGAVSQKHMIYQWQAPINNMNLLLENIQLAELLKLETGIVGEGALNGHLPVSLTNEGAQMTNGKISAESDGIIRYQTDVPIDSAVSNAGVILALDALENFHYDVLDINADYSEAGDMLLKVSLQGRNPDLKEKRPFHFNLQIRENIPALLQSLQLTQKISDSIDRRVKALYQRQ